MIQKRPWFYPGLNFEAYINKYPFVFLLSLPCALGWIFNCYTPWFLANPPTTLNSIGQYSSLVYTAFFGIPFFALLRLMLASPRLKKFTFHTTVYTLGILALYGIYIYLSRPTVPMWIDFLHLFLLAALAAFLYPLWGWKHSINQVRAYPFYFLEGIIRGFAAYFFVGGIAIWSTYLAHQGIGTYLWPNRLFNSLPNDPNHIVSSASQFATFLVFPWYILGCMEDVLNPKEETSPEVRLIGPRFTLTIVIVVVAGYLLEVLKIFKQITAHQSNYFFDEKFVFLVLALISIYMASLQKEGFEKLKGTYRKTLSAVSIGLLLAWYCLFRPYSASYHGSLDYYAFYCGIWFGLIFAYFLFKKEPEWVRPAFSLLALMIFTVAGPLNPMNLALQDEGKYLEKMIKERLNSEGVLKDGVMTKSASPNPRVFNGLQWTFREDAQLEGLNWLRNSFPPELRSLNWDKENSVSLLPKLWDWLGLQQFSNPYYPRYYFSNSRATNGLQKEFWGIQEQDFNCRQGLVVPRKGSRGYFLAFPDNSQSVTLTFKGRALAKINLEKLAKILRKYDYNETVRKWIPPKDMSLEFENQKVKVALLFNSVNAVQENGTYVIKSGSGTLIVKLK